MSALVLYVRLHDRRFHGEGDWPPSPARLFQALVAGAGLAGPLGDAERKALEWLERQDPPTIAVPSSWRPPRGVRLYVPNNDADRIGGDPRRMAEIRTATKVFRPRILDTDAPFVYAWPLEGDDRAETICKLAERLYQLGRGIDMAWAWGEIVDDSGLDELLAAHPGRVFRPSAANGATTLASPSRGSLESLERRHRAYGERFDSGSRGRRGVFSQPPRPRFQSTAYGSPDSRRLYQLEQLTAPGAFAPWPLEHCSALVVLLRDGAVKRLREAIPKRAAVIDRVLIGRKPDGTNDGPTEDRVRIIPLPSIGHMHADREIRRVLVDVPPTCPLGPDDVAWAFSGLPVPDPRTGEVRSELVAEGDLGFVRHYAADGPPSHRVWRTVTAAALPERARRRGAKSGRERAAEQARAAAAVHQALRHANVRAAPEAIRVQREPFEANGAHAEAFAEGTRFTGQRLWHFEVTFRVPVPGPLVLGDGRFLGLGVMAPVAGPRGIHAFSVETGLSRSPDPEHLALSLRRAVMARVQAELGAERLPPFFSGHMADGAPARSESEPHLAFTFDASRWRLLVIAPHLLERRSPSQSETHQLAVLDRALAGLRELKAGPEGILDLRPASLDGENDPLLAPSRVWHTVTPYRVTRHRRSADANAALSTDVEMQLRSLGLPQAAVEPAGVQGVPGRGLQGSARLKFEVAVGGPLLLGRSRFLGGGLFAGEPGRAA